MILMHIYKDYCSHCHITGVPLINNSTKVYKNGDIVHSMYCRKCNLKRSKKYRETEHGRARIRRAVYASIARYPERQAARLKLNYAIKSGRMKRGNCQVCGKAKAHAHHTDYSKPYDVQWYCRQCHSDMHRSNPVLH